MNFTQQLLLLNMFSGPIYQKHEITRVEDSKIIWDWAKGNHQLVRFFSRGCPLVGICRQARNVETTSDERRCNAMHPVRFWLLHECAGWSVSSLGAHVECTFSDVSAQRMLLLCDHKIVRMTITYILCDCIPCIMVHDCWINIFCLPNNSISPTDTKMMYYLWIIQSFQSTWTWN